MKTIAMMMVATLVMSCGADDNGQDCVKSMTGNPDTPDLCTWKAACGATEWSVVLIPSKEKIYASCTMREPNESGYVQSQSGHWEMAAVGPCTPEAVQAAIAVAPDVCGLDSAPNP